LRLQPARALLPSEPERVNTRGGKQCTHNALAHLCEEVVFLLTGRPLLYVITNRMQCRRPLPELLADAARDGGLDMVQLREKDLPPAALVRLAKEVVRALAPYGVPVLVNARPRDAWEAGAAGVHVPSAGDLAYVRNRLFAGGIVSAAVHSPGEAVERQQSDWLLYGHVYETPSKAGLPARGLAALATACRLAPGKILAVGGITPARVAEVLAAGSAGVAVVSSIMQAADPAGAVAAFRQALDSPRKE
jgi:thiamine-phosphate diphosphorylase